MASWRTILLFVLLLATHGVVATVRLSDTFSLSGGARAYYENAYISSTGNWKYDSPVIEQYIDLKLDAAEYGWLMTDAWIFSDVAGTCRDVHRSAFSCYEGTLVYGYDLNCSDDKSVFLRTAGGGLWDWLGGYKTYAGIPICYLACQSLENPYLTPYWNFLGGPITGGPTWTRCRFGVRRDFHPFETLTLTPYTDATWGDANRFEKNYGDTPNNRVLGGAIMFGVVGVIVKWYFSDHFYLWGRYRHIFTIDGQARHLIHDRTSGPNTTEYPIFGIGLGCRF